jgi:hypothetical protein
MQTMVAVKSDGQWRSAAFEGGLARATHNRLGNLRALTPIADALLISVCSLMPWNSGRYASTR